MYEYAEQRAYSSDVMYGSLMLIDAECHAIAAGVVDGSSAKH